MTRLLFNLTAGISALLCVATIVVCIRSQSKSDEVHLVNDSHGDGSEGQQSDESVAARRPKWSSGDWNDDWGAFTDRRGVELTHNRVDFSGGGFGGSPYLLTGWHWSSDTADQSSEKSFWPNFSERGSFSPPNVNGSIYLYLPHWLLILTCATLPSLFALRWLVNRRRARVGCCKKCGYDLRATPDRCPECGRGSERVR